MDARPSADRVPRLDNRIAIGCALAFGAGCIHVEAAFEHVSEYALYAVFFAVLAPAQLAWGVSMYRRRSRRLLRIGMFGSLAIVALWLVSRTTGLPIGPEPWQPESVGALDVLASLDELCLALAALSYLHPRPDTAVARRLSAIVIPCGLLLALASSLALVSSGHAH